MLFSEFIVLASYIIVFGNCKMKPFIVGGQNAAIDDFPYSAHLGVECYDGEETVSWVCGGSIINQYLLLTAGHCLYSCTRGSSISASFGHANILKASSTTVRSFAVHQRYCNSEGSNDIALVRLSTELTFDSTVNRVVLMGRPPYREEALVAGWGLVDIQVIAYEVRLHMSIVGKSDIKILLFMPLPLIEEIREVETNVLKYTKQYVWERQDCWNLLQTIPEGSICARAKDRSSYASVGDSGSALVVRGYIQIGLVSHKLPVSDSVVIYMDTGYFYNWIRQTANKIMCI